MSYELTLIAILFSSLAGLFFIVFRKIPVLAGLPRTVEKPSRKPLLSLFKERIKSIPALKSFSFELFLQKIISKIRILFLKADNKTSNWLQRLRERHQKRKTEKSDNYWEEIKKSTKK